MTATLIPPLEETKTFTTKPCAPRSSMTSATFGSKKFRCRKPNRGQALIGVTTTTICGTDLHIVSEVKGE